MVNIIRFSKYIIPVILIISVIWIISKKTKATTPDETQGNTISGFDQAMVGVTGIMEKINPSSPFTRQMKAQKERVLNQA